MEEGAAHRVGMQAMFGAGWDGFANWLYRGRKIERCRLKYLITTRMHLHTLRSSTTKPWWATQSKPIYTTLLS
ncbi:MAG: hypothetical protein ITD27_00235 [Nitrosospira sp.]|nr:hypothetical protein [Nitrosospira sp.]